MLEGSRIPETTAAQPLRKLNLVIHPFFTYSPGEHNPQYVAQLGSMRHAILRRYLPQAPDELTALIPCFNDESNQLGEFFDGREPQTELMGVEKEGWITLMREALALSVYPENVILGQDVVSGKNVVPFLERLSKKKKKITAETRVNLCGEFFDMCVSLTAINMLQKTDATSVRIRPDACTTYGEFISGQRLEVLNPFIVLPEFPTEYVDGDLIIRKPAQAEKS